MLNLFGLNISAVYIKYKTISNLEQNYKPVFWHQRKGLQCLTQIKTSQHHLAIMAYVAITDILSPFCRYPSLICKLHWYRIPGEESLVTVKGTPTYSFTSYWYAHCIHKNMIQTMVELLNRFFIISVRRALQRSLVIDLLVLSFLFWGWATASQTDSFAAFKQ